MNASDWQQTFYDCTSFPPKSFYQTRRGHLVQVVARDHHSLSGPPRTDYRRRRGTAVRRDRHVILFESEWGLRYFERHHPDVVLLAESPVTTATPR